MERFGNDINLIAKRRPVAVERTSQNLTVQRLHPETGQLVETSMRWGLIPNFADERPEFQPRYVPAEIISQRRMFHDAYRTRRCVVLMKEIQQRDKHRKRITIVRRDGKPHNVAGIWENWRDPSTSKWERTFAIVVVSSGGSIPNVYNRTPLILDEANLYRWLSSENDPRDLLKSRTFSARPWDDEIMIFQLSAAKNRED